jgi:hypothetical protein
MNNEIEQQFLNGALTGGPVVPVPVHPSIQSAYSNVLPQSQFINNWESSNLITMTGFNTSLTARVTDVNMDNDKGKVKAFTASVTGSNSGYFSVIGGLLKQRNYMSGLTATTTATLSSSTTFRDIGVFSVRKLFYDQAIENGSLTATVTGTAFDSTDMSGDYYDSGSGQFIRKSDGATIGVSLPDDGMFVVTSSNSREVAVSVTSVKYRTKVLNTTLNVFCKAEPYEMNYSLNPTLAMQNAVSSDTVSSGEIRQSYNNILCHSTLTATTDQFKFISGMVSSGWNFSPYITVVGLYNDNNDLLAVSKISTPMKKPTDLPLTFKVQIDV